MTAPASLQRIRTLTLVLLLSGATLLTAACGGSDEDPADASPTSAAASSDDAGDAADAPSGGETPDPCSLVSAADLQEAWGVEFNEGEASETTPPFTFHVCSFGQTSNEPPARTLTVQVLGTADIDEKLRDGGQTAKAVFEGQRDAASDASPVEGLGDDAYRTGSEVTFLSGDLYVTLAAPGASDPETLEGLESLAGTVAANL